MSSEMIDISGGGRAGMGDGGTLMGLILGAAFSGGGLFGNRNDGAAAAVVSNETATRTLEQTIALLQSSCAQTATITSELNSLGTNMNMGFADTKSAINGVGVLLAQSIAGVNQSVVEAKYDNALQVCAQTSALTAAITNGNQRILDQMNCQAIKDLERQLAVAENGGPIVRAGAFIPVNPCHQNDQINIINQNVNAIGSSVSQLAGVVSKLVK